jgi:hypothetical protein
MNTTEWVRIGRGPHTAPRVNANLKSGVLSFNKAARLVALSLIPKQDKSSINTVYYEGYINPDLTQIMLKPSPDGDYRMWIEAGNMSCKPLLAPFAEKYFTSPSSRHLYFDVKAEDGNLILTRKDEE